MELRQYSEVSLFVVTITACGLALADCPRSMPEQLLEDCIISEGAGSDFPPSDYAYMELYNTWLAQQQRTKMAKDANISAMEKMGPKSTGYR